MILGFQQLRVPTWFCFAEWRRAILHGRKPTKLIESEEHMLIDPAPNHKPLMLKKSSTKESSMPCRYFQKNSCSHKSDHDTCTFVAFVTPRARLLPHSSKDCHEAKKLLGHCNARYCIQYLSKSV